MIRRFMLFLLHERIHQADADSGYIIASS